VGEAGEPPTGRHGHLGRCRLTTRPARTPRLAASRPRSSDTNAVSTRSSPHRSPTRCTSCASAGYVGSSSFASISSTPVIAQPSPSRSSRSQYPSVRLCIPPLERPEAHVQNVDVLVVRYPQVHRLETLYKVGTLGQNPLTFRAMSPRFRLQIDHCPAALSPDVDHAGCPRQIRVIRDVHRPDRPISGADKHQEATQFSRCRPTVRPA
jgi:hypothetical protein